MHHIGSLCPGRYSIIIYLAISFFVSALKGSPHSSQKLRRALSRLVYKHATRTFLSFSPPETDLDAEFAQYTEV